MEDSTKSIEEINIVQILELICRDNEGFDLYNNDPTEFTPDTISDHFVYKVYI